jgi:hypothetical protein
MPAQVMCPNLRCRKVLSVPDEARGKVVKCQACQSLLKVPEPKHPVGSNASHASSSAHK